MTLQLDNLDTASSADADWPCSNETFPKIPITNSEEQQQLLSIDGAVEELKEEFGVEPAMEPFETLSFCDQVKFHSKTNVMTHPHGVALTGMIFMPDNWGTLELFPMGHCGSLAAVIDLDHVQHWAQSDPMIIESFVHSFICPNTQQRQTMDHEDHRQTGSPFS